MPLEQERAFGADSPVGRYWLRNCVGFHVEGLRVGSGTVEEVGLGKDGVDVLAVRRRGVLQGTIHVPVDRVESVHPWEDTLVLHSRRRAALERRRSQARHVVPYVHPIAERALRVAWTLLLRVLAALGTFLLGLAVQVRRYSPRLAAMLTNVALAYAAEAKRMWHAEQEAIAAWRKSRRVRGEEPGDEGPLTRAGADDAGARREQTRS